MLLIIVCVASAVFLALARNKTSVSASPAPTSGPTTVPAINFREGAIRVEGATLRVQIADTPEASERGLMFRDSVAPYDGMLFIFDKPQQVVFWMRNTRIPLDVGYFDSQRILREVYPLMPFDETPVYSQSADILYGLELPRGDFVKKGLKVGDKLEN